MSDDVLAKVKSFTPTMPDRDALLVAAGRASAKPSPVWKVVCGLLAASQAVTLTIAMTRRESRVETPRPTVPETLPYIETPPEPYSYLALRHSDGFSPPRPSSFSNSPERPGRPLTAGLIRDWPQ